MTFPTTTTPNIASTEVFPPRIAAALDTLAASVIADLTTVAPTVPSSYGGALTGPSTAGVAVPLAIPAGATMVFTITAVAKVTTKGGGTENVGDSYHLETKVTAKNVGGTVSIVNNVTQVSVQDSDPSMVSLEVGNASQYTFAASGANLSLGWLNPSGINAGTVVTHSILVSSRQF
jgi:hypothetical protein